MKTVEIRDDSAFGPAVAGGARFVYFYSAWCPFCLAFSPAFDRLAAGSGLECLKASVDKLPKSEEYFSVEVVPTVLFFSGGKVARRLDGALGRGLSESQLRAFALACQGEQKP